MKKNKRRIIFLLPALIIIAAIGFVGANIVNGNLSPTDSSALYGGKLESGYPYAGYLIAFTQDNKITTCGASFLSPTIAISAAHCIPAGATIYVGTGDFKLQSAENVLASDSSIDPQWKGKPSGDISVLKLSGSVNNLNQFVEITAPQKNCNYEIVGYGLNENSVEGDLQTKTRKSAEICIEDMFEDQIFFRGSTGGICYGDSGSPVFEKGTNKLIGIVSSIITSGSTASNYCSSGNRGVIVRLDADLDFVNSYTANFTGGLNTLPKCSQTCSNNSCDKGLACSASNFCVLSKSGGCIADESEYCSFASNIGCQSGYSCVVGKCTKNATNLAQANISGQQQTNIFQTISSTLNSLNSDANRNIYIGIIVSLLLIIGYLLLRLRRKY